LTPGQVMKQLFEQAPIATTGLFDGPDLYGVHTLFATLLLEFDLVVFANLIDQSR